MHRLPYFRCRLLNLPALPAHLHAGPALRGAAQGVLVALKGTQETQMVRRMCCRCCALTARGTAHMYQPDACRLRQSKSPRCLSWWNPTLQSSWPL
jgi:hypothetical protein